MKFKSCIDSVPCRWTHVDHLGVRKTWQRVATHRPVGSAVQLMTCNGKQICRVVCGHSPYSINASEQKESQARNQWLCKALTSTCQCCYIVYGQSLTSLILCCLHFPISYLSLFIALMYCTLTGGQHIFTSRPNFSMAFRNSSRGPNILQFEFWENLFGGQMFCRSYYIQKQEIV